MTTIDQVIEIIKESTSNKHITSLLNVPLFKKIEKKIQNNEALVFLLPAFPAKSPNPLKTTGVMPDLGEVIALRGLNNLCEEIKKIYTPGAKIVICSDGRVFSDVVKVGDEEISKYQQGILDIIAEFNLSNLEAFCLDDLYPEKTGDELREILLNKFAKSIEEVKELIQKEESYKNLFNGLHRFLIEDYLVLNPELSKNKITNITKTLTYELMRRSDAWSLLLDNYFSDNLRFSIHPYSPEHSKFGIKLVASSSKWATPWHNVTVKIKDSFELMHKKEALKLKAIPKLLQDKYAYFEITEI